MDADYSLMATRLGLAMLATSVPAQAGNLICAYDPAGKSGDYFKLRMTGFSNTAGESGYPSFDWEGIGAP